LAKKNSVSSGATPKSVSNEKTRMLYIGLSIFILGALVWWVYRKRNSKMILDQVVDTALKEISIVDDTDEEVIVQKTA
jgi:hypothetical protein